MSGSGAILNLIAIGNDNVILTGNPEVTFFKTAYKKYTNFGLQKFRIDYDGMRVLRLTEPSTFKFKFPRNVDFATNMDTDLYEFAKAFDYIQSGYFSLASMNINS